jgi:cytochrome b561
MENEKEQPALQGSFHPIAKALHWAVAILLIVSLVLGFISEGLSEIEKAGIVGLHASLGLLILVAVFLRIAWRRKHVVPELPSSMSRRYVIISKSTTHSLYLLMVLQPLIGVLYALARLPIFSGASRALQVIHTSLTGLLILVIGLHVLIALRHLLIDKDGVFQRMWPGGTSA